MSNCVCLKCGATATSKCPFCRTVFLDNQIKSMLGSCIKFDEGIQNEEYRKMEIKIHFRAKNNEELIEAFIEILQSMKETKEGTVQFPSLKQYFCHHSWQFAEGCKSIIDCGH